MHKSLFKNKGIQFGVLYDNFVQRLKKSSNELSYVDYIKIMDSEKALRHYSDRCLTSFCKYQLSVARQMADKDAMIKSLISNSHKYATVISNLQHQANKHPNTKIINELSQAKNKIDTYKAHIKHLNERCAALKSSNADAIKAVNMYKKQYNKEKANADAKPKVKVVKVPAEETGSNPQSNNTLSDDTAQTQANDSDKPKNPFLGPNMIQQSSDEKAQHNRAESDSNNSESDINSSNDGAKNHLEAFRRRASSNSSQNTDKRKFQRSKKTHKETSTSQNADPSELAKRSYKLSDDTVDPNINKFSDSMSISGLSNEQDSDSDKSGPTSGNSGNDKDNAQSNESNSDGPKVPSEGTSDGAPTLSM